MAAVFDAAAFETHFRAFGRKAATLAGQTAAINTALSASENSKEKIMKMLKELRRRQDEAATRKAIRHLDNHLLRDIGLPEREPQLRSSFF